MATVERSLTERLADQVRDHMLRHRRAIEGGIGQVRSLHVEMSIGRDAQLGETTFWVEHRTLPGPRAWGST
jgi:hypothetical protein